MEIITMKKKITAFAAAVVLLFSTASAAYTDLENYGWASDAVYSLTEKEIMEGIGNDMFDPSGNVTYEQLAKMAVLAFGEVKETDEVSFKDVPKEKWSHKYVESAKAWFGINGDTFGAENDMPRIEVARVMVNALGAELVTDGTAFTDNAEISDELKPYAYTAEKLGIINGYPDGSFKPNGSITRAEAAVMLERTLKSVKPADPAPTPTPDATPAPDATPSPSPTPTPDSGNNQQMKSRMDFFVVTNVSPVLVDGEETYKIEGYSGEEEYSFTCEKAQTQYNGNLTSDQISKGDVLSVVYDVRSKARVVQRLFNISEHYSDDYAVNGFNKTKIYSVGFMDYYCGLVRKSVSSSIALSKDATAEASESVAVKSDTVYYEYFPKSKTVKLSDKGSIYPEKKILETPYSDDGSIVFVRTEDGIAKEVYILNNK